MVLITSVLTGFFAAMLRSLFAMIAVAFLISVLFFVAFALYGAPLIGLILSIAGFNIGLIIFAAAYILRSGARPT